MSKQIEKAEVLHIAELAALELNDEEAEAQRLHLQKMVKNCETLDLFDVSDIPPTAHILSAVNVLRDDVVRPSMDNAELLANAPDTDGGAYVVPRVVE